MRKYLIDDPIYGAEIILLVGTPQDYKSTLRRTFKDVPKRAFAIDDAMGATEAFLKKSGTQANIVWLNGWKDDVEHLGILVHESVHCMNFIFLYADVFYSMEKDEVAAYYLDWIFTQCLKRLRKGK